MTKPIQASCHCGAVQITLAAPPDYLSECNCRLCNSHGVWWGYYAPDQVQIVGETKTYARTDKPDPTVHIHFCDICGCTTHWTPTPVFVEKVGEANRMGTNMRLFDRAALAGIELRFPDGHGWDGIGQWGFVRESVILD